MSRRKPPAAPVDPPTLDSATSEQPLPIYQSNFWITNEDGDLLDTWVLTLKRGGWRTATRSSCIRALLQLVRDHPPDLAHVGSEPEFAQAVLRALATSKRES